MLGTLGMPGTCCARCAVDLLGRKYRVSLPLARAAAALVRNRNCSAMNNMPHAPPFLYGQKENIYEAELPERTNTRN